MTDDFLDTLCYRYLADEMGGEERRSFEARLAMDPQVEETLRRVAEAASDYVRAEVSPASTAVVSEHWIRLKRRLPVPSPRQPEERASRSSGLPWLWPAAACFFAALWLAQWAPWDSGRENLPVETSQALSAPSSSVPGVARSSLPAVSLAPGEPQTGAAISLDRVEDFSTATRDELRREIVRLREAQSLLRSENRWLLSQAESLVALGPGGGRRLSVLEMVDRASYEQGRRLGLARALKQILTPPVSNTVGTVSGVPNALAFQETSRNPAPSPVGEAAVQTIQVTSLFDTPANGAKETPYAWSVFDEERGESFHTFYNLPQVGANDGLYLWVKPAEAESYLLVGQLPPALAGHSGGVYVPASPNAGEIVVTRQRLGQVPPQPGDGWVLRGP